MITLLMNKGLFITFEGIDGCGKSTQARLLANYILDLSKYNHVIMTREPYKDADIRKILMQDEDPYSQAQRLAKLFVKDRKKHVEEVINPLIRKGLHVISDRYSGSTLAYQQAQGIPLQELLDMHKGLPIPHLTFLVDVPANIAIQRMRGDDIRKTEQKFEKKKEFIEKLRRFYLDLKNIDNHKIEVIDGTKSIKEIFEKQIKPIFDKFYNKLLQ